jgi:catalase
MADAGVAWRTPTQQPTGTHRTDEDCYSQPQALLRLMTPAQRQALFEYTARSIRGASRAIKDRHIANCAKADPAYGAGVAAAIDSLASPL